MRVFVMLSAGLGVSPFLDFTSRGRYGEVAGEVVASGRYFAPSAVYVG